jgi:hypothetical protein
MPSRKITVQMDDTTINALVNSGFSLYVMKAVKTDLKSGYALVWIKITAFSQNTLVQWKDEYLAYSTQQTTINNNQVVAGQNVYAINLGQTLSISKPSGTGEVYNDGIANTIAVSNKTTTQFSCGIGQNTYGKGNCLCVVPLYGGMIDLFGLVDSVLLTIEATQREINSAIAQSTAPSLMVNMDGGTARTVTYHINTNWAGNQEGWCTQIAAGTNLTPWLLQPYSGSAEEKRLLAARLA